MIRFLENYWLTVVIVAIVLAYIIYLVINKRWNKLRMIANKLMLQAEHTIIGTKKGQERFEQVLTQVYLLVPVWIRIFITRTQFEKILQDWFELIKDSLDDGKINNSVEKDSICIENRQE